MMSDIQLIHVSSKITVLSRILIVICIFVIQQSGGYLPTEAKYLAFCILPMSCYYLSAYIRFALKYPYPLPDQKRKLKANLIIVPLIVGYLFLAILIILTGLLRVPSYQLLLISVIITECLFAMHAAFSLPEIFKRFSL